MTTGKPGSRGAGKPVGRRTGSPVPRFPGSPTGSPVSRFPGSPVRRLRSRQDGLSALFDAILFFIIILAATGALFWWASAMTARTTDDLATRDLGRSASDIQSSALECDVGPVDYSVLGENITFSGSVHDCLRAILLARHADANCDIAGMVEAVRGIYGLLVEKPYHFEVRAEALGLGPDLVISESATGLSESATGLSESATGSPDSADGPFGPGAVRWTSAVPITVNGVEGELTLYVWR